MVEVKPVVADGKMRKKIERRGRKTCLIKTSAHEFKDFAASVQETAWAVTSDQDI